MENITGWRTSTRTQGQGQCVEVGFGGERVGVRDTKNRAAGHFTVARGRWREFVAGIKQGYADVWATRGPVPRGWGHSGRSVV